MDIGAPVKVIADPAGQRRQDRAEAAPVVGQNFACGADQEIAILAGRVAGIGDGALRFGMFAEKGNLVTPARLRIVRGRIEAEFEDPAGGPPHRVTAKLTPRSSRYGLRSPPLRGIEANRPYHVSVRLVQNGDGAVLFRETFTVASKISDRIVPSEPLTVGPGYARNPNLPHGWQAPIMDRGLDQPG